MRVTATISVEVDVRAWNREYASNETPAQIREAVKASIADAANHTFAHLTQTVYGQRKADGFIRYTVEPIVKIVNTK